MDNALKKAEDLKFEMSQRFATLTAELAFVESELERANRFISEYNAFISGDTAPDTKEKESPRRTLTLRKRYRNPPKEQVAECAVQIIRERGEPISRDDLYDSLAEKDFHIKGKDPRMVLSTMLWRQPELIVRLKRGGYWPASDPLPDGEEVSTRAASE